MSSDSGGYRVLASSSLVNALLKLGFSIPQIQEMANRLLKVDELDKSSDELTEEETATLMLAGFLDGYRKLLPADASESGGDDERPGPHQPEDL
jgi:hypothetical protein